MILDNAKIHMYSEFVEMIEKMGAVVVFLPPYYPQLNPIELAFNTLKSWMRRYVGRLWNLDPHGVIDVAMKNCLSTNELNDDISNSKRKKRKKSAFNHCGYYETAS